MISNDVGKKTIPLISESMDNERQSNLQEEKDKLVELIRKHQLSEVLTWFQMADEFQIHFTFSEIREIYETVQDEMVNIFGAPLAKSLFPSFIFDNKHQILPSEETQQQSPSSCS